ncbi:hypothetical protein BEWA_007690 [Theileria equi strain WA]|uniref:RRM domain-containing protein n=1 Tax=Theileria equi strain WA TaxID=1537102 RepID=L0B0L8_THEEQ|nr:hypothetical protein BEWA_007690 [Theileria equi strain WA]AFZ81360.1 hypothetical protein BEWA_007690 [Theileria equi strain WA]|eukprot:XP_004831026.1 hypothetical protein BEWA_007690 [Theileria equi strain WA]
MDVDPVKAPKQNAENPNRIYKNAIRGILLNKTKTDKKVRKSIFDRIEWDHDLFRSMVSTEPGSMIYVRNLPNDITNDELKAYFELVDPVVSIKVCL